MRAAKIFSGPGLIAIGLLHFLVPKPFEDIVPEALPAKRALVYASGVTEIATGVGSLHPRTRRWAGGLGIATMLGVYPANVQMALNPGKYPQIPAPLLWARLPLQGVFIFWLYKRCLSRDAAT
jgi:uncharacterized membrane protein